MSRAITVDPLDVVIADDSFIAVERLRQILAGHASIRVVATAQSASELQAVVQRTTPAVVLLDLLLPDRPGLSLIRELAERASVIVVSDSPSGSALAVESLAQGAFAFMAKRQLGGLAGEAELVQTVLRARRTTRELRTEALIAIAGSTGAMQALEQIIPDLSRVDAAVVVLQHLPASSMPSFASWLTSLGLPSRVAAQGDRLCAGQALVAPGDCHMRISMGRVALDSSPPVAGHRPSACVLFQSLVSYPYQVIAVVLSGMGRDGSSAMRDLMRAGARCFVQDAASCAVASMPQAARAQAGNAARALPPKLIGPAIRAAVGVRHG